MKNIIIFIFTLILFAGISKANAKEITPKAQELVFNAIADYIYAGENGGVRAPSKVSDFNYDQVSDEKVIVQGESFSELDQRIIRYYCEIEILGRGVIESIYDFEITVCSISL